MIVSSVARAGLVTETRRPENAQVTTQNSNDVSSAAQATQQQAAASNDVQFTRAPERSAGLKLSVQFNGFGDTGNEVETQSATQTAAENDLLQKSIVTQNNTTLQQQIQARVRQIYEFA